MTADRRLVVAIAVLALAGAGVAGYLTYVHYAHVSVLCVSSIIMTSPGTMKEP